MMNRSRLHERQQQMKAGNCPAEIAPSETTRGSVAVLRFKEKHYSVNEIAEMWSTSRDTVRRIFLNEPGVIDVSANPHGRDNKRKRRHRTLLVPESVVGRVYARRSLPAAA
jgi:hypothetical protein